MYQSVNGMDFLFMLEKYLWEFLGKHAIYVFIHAILVEEMLNLLGSDLINLLLLKYVFGE